MEGDPNLTANSVPNGVTASSVTSIDFDLPDNLVGRKLDGRFVIEKNLTEGGADEGGIGVVYLARDLKMLNRRVVVKVLQQAALKHKDILRKFLHEEEALMRLDHPGIVRILDFGQLTDGNPFMVMEFIEGHSLRKSIRTHGTLPLDLAAHYIESITDALGVAHAEKIIHRDIKPENIMITPQEDGYDRVRLIDFGIAKVEESTLAPKTEISRAIGTVRYIAPEQLAGSLYLGPPADIYSVAVVAYEMLTGQLPFRPETMIQMYRLQQEGLKTKPRELRPEVPPEAEEILLKALAFDSENRPQNARAFGRDLGRALRSARIQVPADVEDLSNFRTELAGDEVVTALRADGLNVPDDSTTAEAGSGLPVKWIAAGVLSFAVLAVIAVIWLWNAGGPPVSGPANTSVNAAPAGPPAVETQISFYMTLWKKLGRNKFSDPQQFGSLAYAASPGDEIAMAFEATSDGHFYLWNEGKLESGETGYSPLFPTPFLNEGSSKVKAAKLMETPRNEFVGATGTEVFYLIWSKTPLEELDSIWKKTAAQRQGAVSSAADIETIKSFQQRYESSKAEGIPDESGERIRLKSTGDLIIHRFTMKQI